MSRSLPSAVVQRDVLLKRLRQEVERFEAPGDPGAVSRLSLGSPLLDQLVPGGGVRRGVILEWVPTDSGSGATTLALMAAAVICREPRVLVVVEREGDAGFYPPAAAQRGIDLTRTIVVRPENDRDAEWVVDQCLRNGSVGAVLYWPRRPHERMFRRWQLAAAAGGGWGLFIREDLKVPRRSPADRGCVGEALQTGAKRAPPSPPPRPLRIEQERSSTLPPSAGDRRGTIVSRLSEADRGCVDQAPQAGANRALPATPSTPSTLRIEQERPSTLPPSAGDRRGTIGARAGPSWAELRLGVSPLMARTGEANAREWGREGPLDCRRVRVELLRARGGQAGKAIEIEFDDETGTLRLVPALAAPAAPARAL